MLVELIESLKQNNLGLGGSCSGQRWDRRARDLTDLYLSLDVRQLRREGLLEPGRLFRWRWTGEGEMVAAVDVRIDAERVNLSYRTRGEDRDDWAAKEYAVTIERTPCHFGGSRPWLLCPVAGCGRRVAILYGGPIFACRHCHRLAYRCQRETVDERAARRADKIRGRLGWPPGLWNARGNKKKGMNWRTFGRLAMSHEAFAAAAFRALTREAHRLSELAHQKL